MHKVKTKTKSKIDVHPIEKNILDTLHYRSLFSSSVTFYQLGTFLITEAKTEFTDFSKHLQNATLGNRINLKRKFYYKSETACVNWAKRAKHSQEHLENASLAFSYLAKIKWIKLLAVTGSVAAYNAKPDDDVDIFIITEKNRLWLTRLFVVLLLKVLDFYPQTNIRSGKLCPNLYVDESHMMWDKSKQNIYTAHEILMMHPIIHRDDIYFKFIKSNSWVFTFFGNFAVNLPSRFHKKDTKYASRFVDRLEAITRTLQIWYMRKRKTNEVTTKSFIHFNKVDHLPIVMSKMETGV